MGGGPSPEQASPAVLSQHWSPACCHGRREFIRASALSCAKDATSGSCSHLAQVQIKSLHREVEVGLCPPPPAPRH